jgi:hypothetical protein
VNAADPPDISIDVFAHFAGSAEVRAPKGIRVVKRPAPGGSELDPPEALVMMDPGELEEVRRRPKGKKNPLILVSHGRKANLTRKRAQIESALAANRAVEVHVYDEPPRRS